MTTAFFSPTLSYVHCILLLPEIRFHSHVLIGLWTYDFPSIRMILTRTSALQLSTTSPLIMSLWENDAETFSSSNYSSSVSFWEGAALKHINCISSQYWNSAEQPQWPRDWAFFNSLNYVLTQAAQQPGFWDCQYSTSIQLVNIYQKSHDFKSQTLKRLETTFPLMLLRYCLSLDLQVPILQTHTVNCNSQFLQQAEREKYYLFIK